VNHVPDSAVLQSVIDGTALVVFVLAVAILSEYVFLNGYPLHRLAAFAGAVPLVPLLPRYVDGLAAQPAVVTWMAAVALGWFAVTSCQRAVVVPLDRAIEERRHRRELQEMRASLRVAPVSPEPVTPVPDPHYFRPADELDAALGPVVTAGDPLARATHRRPRDVA
jgi:hypothetical protein